MKKILVLSFFPAFNPPKSGGEVRVYNLYFELSKYFDITLLTSTHYGVDEEIIYHNVNFKERRIPKDDHFNEAWNNLTPHAGEGDLSAISLLQSTKKVTKLNQAFFDEYIDADIIIHDFPFTINLDILSGFDNKIRIFNSQNCEYELYKKLHLSNKSSLIHNLVKECENKLILSSDVLTYCGEGDLQFFNQYYELNNINAHYLPNGFLKTSVLNKKKIKSIKNIVFIGSSHLPNIEAASYIANTLATKFPNITFNFIGNCLKGKIYSKNVINHGLVSDTEKLKIFSICDLALNTVISGSGSNLKTLDYISHRIPLLTTEFGIRGLGLINEEHCITCKLEDFVVKIREIDNSFDLEKLSNNAYEFCSKNYSWSTLASKFEKIIHSSLKSTKNTKPLILTLNDYNPITTSGGGATRIKGIYRNLSKFYKVITLCFSDNDEYYVNKYYSDWLVIGIPKSTSHLKDELEETSKFWISIVDIVASRHATKNIDLIKIYEILSLSAKHIIIDHPYMVNLPIIKGDKFIYSSQNHEYELKKQLLEYHPDRSSILSEVKNLELLSIVRSSSIFAVSDSDAELFSKSPVTTSQIIVVPNGSEIPTEATQADIRYVKSKIQKKSVVFLGSSHIPNVESVNFIIDELASSLPDVQFNIVGSVCNSINNVKSLNILLWGVVSDSLKTAILENSALAINPMFSGGGSNVKLSDYLANGLYVLSTEFGIRGYDANILDEVEVIDKELFNVKINKLLKEDFIYNTNDRIRRKTIFSNFLSMDHHSKKIVSHLSDLEKPKKKVLFVTYRYTKPCLGGAESMLFELIKKLANTSKYFIDIVTIDTNLITEKFRFSSNFYKSDDQGNFYNLPNTRLFKFPVNVLSEQNQYIEASKIWRTQSLFEQKIYENIQKYLTKNMTAWGWCLDSISQSYCWTLDFFGIHLATDSFIQLKFKLDFISSLRIIDNNGNILYHETLNGYCSINLYATKGSLSFYVASSDKYADDCRPLGLLVLSLSINNIDIDFYNNSTCILDSLPDSLVFEILHNSSIGSRFNNILTDARGPHSSLLEKFLQKHITSYDLVISHNSVFKTTVKSIEAAKNNNIPSILIPHVHLDDDFYHFPDVINASRDASVVLASPKVACDFLSKNGCNIVKYLPAGIDLSENYTDDDSSAFNNIYNNTLPFVLVLGRKSLAKNYNSIITAVKITNLALNVVMIGPNEDNHEICGNNVFYFGQQPRNVVRGALNECMMLVNMSDSESFGIVVLEAWLAKKPVICNSDCAAFHDLITHGYNGLLTSKINLADTISHLFNSLDVQNELGNNGYRSLNDYNWDSISNTLITTCDELTNLN